MTHYTISVPVRDDVEDETPKFRITPALAGTETQLVLSTTPAGQYLLFYQVHRRTLAISVDDLIAALSSPLPVDVVATRDHYRDALLVIRKICEIRLNESTEIHAVADVVQEALKGVSSAQG